MHHSAAVAGLLATTGLWPLAARAQSAAANAWNKAAFDANSLADVARALGGGRPTPSNDVWLTAPDIAENGTVVPIGFGARVPGPHRVALLIEKNPTKLIAVFEPTEFVESNFSLRTKMSESSNVYAVALLPDGRALFAQKDVRVTLGGCGV